MKTKQAKKMTRKEAGKAFYLNGFAHPHFELKRIENGWSATSKVGAGLTMVIVDGEDRPTHPSERERGKLGGYMID